MKLLTVHHLAKSYSLKQLFKDVTFSINQGDRLGLVGPNGCGKSTLLRIITSKETADSGHVSRDPVLRIGYLPQGLEIADDVLVADIIGNAAGAPRALESELTRLAEALENSPENESLQKDYDALLQRVGSPDIARIAKILNGLALNDLPPDATTTILSGGQKTRLSLALALLDEPQLLLLDEPTNHLDIDTLEWLEMWLSEFQGGALIVSHDRMFLDRSVTRILYMDPTQQTIREYAGAYSDFVKQRDVELAKERAIYRDQQQEIKRIHQDIIRAKAQAAHTERQASSVRIGGEQMKLKGFKDYQQSIAKKVARKARSREKKLDRYLSSERIVEKPKQTRKMRLDFSEMEHLGKSVFSLRDLSTGYDHAIPLLSGLNLEARPGARIVLTGPNGSGKSTLLRTIAGELDPISGTVLVGSTVNLGFMTQAQDEIDPALTPLRTIQPFFNNETDARTFLGYFLFTGEEVLIQNRRLSFGQRARLTLAKLVTTGCNVLLLDEPINHLDIPSRDKFEEALDPFPGTIVAVVHDRYFIDRFADEIWLVSDGGIRRILR